MARDPLAHPPESKRSCREARGRPEASFSEQRSTVRPLRNPCHDTWPTPAVAPARMMAVLAEWADKTPKIGCAGFAPARAAARTIALRLQTPQTTLDVLQMHSRRMDVTDRAFFLVLSTMVAEFPLTFT